MNRFLKNKAAWIGLFGTILLLIVLAIFFRPNPPDYKLNLTQTLLLMKDSSLAITVNTLTGKQLIDIRQAESYTQSHAQNAVNIPARQLLDKESIKLFKELKSEGKVAVLYGSSELQVVSPWLLLQQLGYTNVLRLKGYITADGKLAQTELALSESSVLNLSAFGEKPAPSPAPKISGEPQKQESIKLGKKTSSSGGGC